jgi:hypothetical protein
MRARIDSVFLTDGTWQAVAGHNVVHKTTIRKSSSSKL